VASEPILITVLTDYALAGGLAYGALVEPRATTDVDLLILIDKPTPEKIAALFSSTFESLVPHPSPMEFKDLSIWRQWEYGGGAKSSWICCWRSPNFSERHYGGSGRWIFEVSHFQS